jgi:toxin ParE1/3/4
MADYRLTQQAANDLEEVFDYSIEQFGVLRAERYKVELGRCLDRIARDPRLGRPVGGRTRQFFRYECLRHVVFFTPMPTEILVVRILHGAMDPERHLPD